MSSTFRNYGTPASLPSDYAILTRYAASRPQLACQIVDGEYEHSDHHHDSVHCERPTVARRSSLPSTGSRPIILTLGVPNKNSSFSPTETTPLFRGSAVSVIQEHAGNNSVDDSESAMNMFWDELRVLAKYTLPVFGTHLLEYSLAIASVVSIGHLSTTALAAITLGFMTASVSGYSIVQGFVTALDTVLPSAWTSSQPNLVGLWSQRMTVVMMIWLLPTFAVWVNAETILLCLKQDPEVASLAALYLRWSLLGLPAYTFNLILRRYFQSQGLFTVPTRIIMVVAPINAFLNWLLVWGPEPIRLGFIGAPIATAMSFNLVALMSVMYGMFFAPKTAWHPLSRRCFTNLGILMRLGLSGVGQVASEWWSWELIALAASMLGPVALASQSVLLVSASTTFQGPFALSVATAVRVGNLLGEEKARRAGIAAKTSLVLALAMAGISSTLFLTFRHSWTYMFNNDPKVVELVASILPLVALFQVFDGIAAVTGGILRARGKQFTGALLNLSAYYILGIPLGIWLAFKRDLGLHGLWIGLSFSLIYCAILGTYLCIRTDWRREVQKVLERISVDKLNREMESQR